MTGRRGSGILEVDAAAPAMLPERRQVLTGLEEY
jgi:hypothetical protein